MPDDNGTEATRSDAPSVDESLFGDAADDAAAAVADEQDANKETEQEPEGSDDADEQAGAPEDLKVVVSIKGRQGHHRGATDLVRPAYRVVRRPRPIGADPRDPGGGRTGESQVGRRTQVSGARETRSPARRQNRRGQAAAQTGATEGGADEQQPETLRLF